MSSYVVRAGVPAGAVLLSGSASRRSSSGDGGQAQQCHHREHREDRHPGDGPHPPHREAVRRSRGADRRSALPAGARPRWPPRPGPQPFAEQERDRGQERERDRHRHGHRERRADAHDGQHRDPGHGQTGQGDDHRGPGEHDGAPGRGQGAAHRLDHVEPLGELGPVAGQDEQRVVDPDGQPEHLRERRSRARYGDQLRGHDHRSDRHGHTDQRGEDRHAGRDQRAEGHDQDEERDQQPEQLGHLARVGVALVGVAADRRGHGRGRLRRTCLLDVGERLVGRHLVGELELGQGRRGALVERRSLGAEGVVDRDPLDLVDGLDQGGDLGGVVLVGDLPLLRLEQDLAGRTGQPEPLPEQVLTGLRLGAGDGERVVVPVAQGGRRSAEADEDQHPEADDHPAMPGDGPAEAVQEDGHADVPPQPDEPRFRPAS